MPDNDAAPTPDIEPAIVAHIGRELEAGGRIRAVIAARTALGLGLRDAEEAVGRLFPAGNSDETSAITFDIVAYGPFSPAITQHLSYPPKRYAALATGTMLVDYVLADWSFTPGGPIESALGLASPTNRRLTLDSASSLLGIQDESGENYDDIALNIQALLQSGFTLFVKFGGAG